jgi:hypothetical protein
LATIDLPVHGNATLRSAAANRYDNLLMALSRSWCPE